MDVGGRSGREVEVMMVMDRSLLLLLSIHRAGIKPGNGPGCRVQPCFIREDRGRASRSGRRGGGEPAPRHSSGAALVDIVEGSGHGLNSADSWKVYIFSLLISSTDRLSRYERPSLGFLLKTIWEGSFNKLSLGGGEKYSTLIGADLCLAVI